MDVISTYIEGELHDKIYVEQPETLVQNKQKSKVYKLFKPLYELKQSDREWYRKIDSSITENGEKQTLADSCSYVLVENIKRVIFIIYVDNLILASKDINMLKNVKTKLKKAFKDRFRNNKLYIRN